MLQSAVACECGWERVFVESWQGAGDTTLNLLWRVQNGEGPTFSPKMAVVLIGTNDLTNPIYQLVSRPKSSLGGTHSV